VLVRLRVTELGKLEAELSERQALCMERLDALGG
jgi:hypothetical protein